MKRLNRLKSNSYGTDSELIKTELQNLFEPFLAIFYAQQFVHSFNEIEF